ncbi:MAG TPA: hypothetical protein VG964_00940 [Candidatus Saccharimonadales bacterium]|nr:hypothetical protein [Candidatus Saccharimonadales bacterium]
MVVLFLLGIIVFGIVVMALVGMIGRRRFGIGGQKYFQDKWVELLTRVKTPEGMVLAVIDADKLLDEALRRKGYKGKTTGERLVAAQRDISDNDAVWYAHKLRNRLVHEPNAHLKKSEAQSALAGFRACLKDLEVL